MRIIRNLVLPTPENNFRAYLISNGALALYAIGLVVLNIFFGNIRTVKSYALLSESSLVEFHNQERTKAGLQTLKMNSALNRSAFAKGQAMLKTDCWSHYCPEGKSPWEFFKAENYIYAYAGENLAEGFSDSEAVMRAWMNSKTHRENILKPQFSEIGIAILYGKYQGNANNVLIVAHFGHPKSGSQVITPEITPPTTQPDPSKPIIDAPADGSIVNTRKPEISGRYEDPVEVVINHNTQAEVRSGRLIPNGGVFTYIPNTDLVEGDQVVQAADSSNRNNTSALLKFKIDTTPPILNLDELNLNAVVSGDKEDTYRFQYVQKENLGSVVIEYENDTDVSGTLVGTKVDENTWEVEVPSPVFPRIQNLTIRDLAGNAEKKQLFAKDRERLEVQLQEAGTVKFAATAGASTQSSLNLIGSARTLLTTLTPVQLGLIVFLAALIVLFIVDFTVIRRLKRRYQIELTQRSHLHIPTFGVLILLVLIGNLGGVI